MMNEPDKIDPHAAIHAENELIESEQTSVDIIPTVEALEAAQKEAKDNWEKLLRKEAEFQNLIRRSDIDVDNARKFSTERLAKELLAVVDSFEQGLVYENDQVVKDGMQLTYTLLLDVLLKFGVKAIEPAVGSNFDPACQEAIAMQESPDMGANCIIAVVQKGYYIHHRVLRAARVIVSRAPVSV